MILICNLFINNADHVNNNMRYKNQAEYLKKWTKKVIKI